MKKGVELEYWVVDEEGELCSAKDIVDNLSFAEEEFVRPLLEIKTDPHENVDDLTSEIKEITRKTLQEADSQDKKIVPLGTPLNSGKIQMKDIERGRIQRKIVGKNIRYAKRVAGTHIHFERNNTVEQINRMISLDPALALSNSAHMAEGENVANSARNQIYRYRCYKELPEHGELWKYAESLEDWNNRLDRCFSTFKQRAEKKGIEKEKLEEHFKPEDAIWGPVRLRQDFPTVEWRSPDTNLPSQTIALLKDFSKAMQTDLDKPPFSKIKKLSRKAIKEGTKNKEVKNYLRKKGFNLSNYTHLSKNLVKEENLSREEASKIRLKASEKFKKDVREL